MPEDPFVEVAGGRVPFHLEGLLALVELVAWLVAARPPRTAPPPVTSSPSSGLRRYCQRDLPPRGEGTDPVAPTVQRQMRVASGFCCLCAVLVSRSGGFPSDRRRIIEWTAIGEERHGSTGT